jgi:diguanylate cyclase (GGDEF)-like protein/PAS domain S-box-containing protein
MKHTATSNVNYIDVRCHRRNFELAKRLLMEKMFRKVRLSVSVSAALTLVTGLVLTALLFTSLRRNELEAHAHWFHQHASLRVKLVAEGMSDAVEQLMLANQLFRTMGVVSREQFAAFTAPLLARNPAIQALSFQRFLRDRDRAGYQAAMKRRDPNFLITEYVDGEQRPAGQRANYNVVEYIEPFAGNEAALGLDTGRTSDQSAARERSRSTGRLAATGLLSLVQHQGFHTGFLVLAPLYAPGAALDTPALRQAAVIGETAAVFRADRLLQSLLGGKHLLGTPGISLRIYAAGSADPSQLAFSDGVPAKPPSLPIPAWLLFDQVRKEQATFIVAGSPWHMTVDQAPTPFSAGHAGSLYALLGGILSSLLAAIYVYSLVSRRSTIERVTSERTSLLRDDNRRLSLDLAQRIDAEKTLRLRQKVIDVSSNAILICSAQGPDYAIEYVNPAFESITGYAASEVLGKSLRTFQDDSQDLRNIEEIRAALREQREGHAVLRNYRKDGTGYWNDLFISPLRDDAGAIVNFMVAQYDISAVMRFEAELEYQARHDALTGLANRNLLHERVERAIAEARLSGAGLWVVFIDLDRFKVVNDTLGHDAGDVLLKALAERIKLAVRDTDTVARMGGDEFMLVLPEGSGRDASLAVMRDVMAAIAAPLMIQSHEFYLTCSMGVAAYPNDGDNADTLAKHADIAMYKAKELGRNSYQFYTAAMSARTLERLEMEADLHHALARDEFVLHYQPQIDLRSGTIVGMEVLLRWNRPGHGLVAPAHFIPLAEDMGLIVPIGAWVLRAACAQTVRWQRDGLGELRIAVNLSPRQFTQKGMAQSIAAILDETGLDARFVELELTESMVMDDVDNAIALLHELKQLGVQVAIDDFGTGHSSLSYLRRFPIDILKIDQSFVRDIAPAEDGAAIVRAIISLAHSLRLKVIAEGVETNEQLVYLHNHGCDQVQGYLFSRPVAAAEFEALIRNGLAVGMQGVNSVAQV